MQHGRRAYALNTPASEPRSAQPPVPGQEVGSPDHPRPPVGARQDVIEPLRPLEIIYGILASCVWLICLIQAVGLAFTVVGVVEDVKQNDWREVGQSLMYLPLTGPLPGAWAMGSPDAPLMPAAAVLTLALAAWRVLPWSRRPPRPQAIVRSIPPWSNA